MWASEGNGNPLQCSCLENPRDGGAWWAAIYGVAQSQTEVTQQQQQHMQANLENSAVATGLEKVSFHSIPKERQSQRVLTTTQLHLSHTLAK